MLIIDPLLEKALWVLAGAVISWVFQQYRVARAEDVALINEHIKDLEKFRDSSQDYWLKIPKDAAEEQSMAARVRAAHAATTLLYQSMIETCYWEGDQYKRLSIELFGAATGGAFETAARGIEPERAIQVSDLTAQIIHILRRSRKDTLSLSRLGRSFVPRIDFER